MIHKLVNGNNLSNTDAIKWGTDHGEDRLKPFHIQEAMSHADYKTSRCGLFVDKNKQYIAASPDGIFSCKCHESYVIEIKCPFKFRDQFIKERINDCEFVEILDGKIHLKKIYNYYTQVVSQMAVAGGSLLLSLFEH